MRIRNDQNYWDGVEDYLAARTDVRFSHGVCPDCFARVEEELDREKKKRRSTGSSD